MVTVRAYRRMNVMQSYPPFLVILIVIMMTLVFGLYQSMNTSSSLFSRNEHNCVVWFGEYKGHKYKSPGQTMGEGKCLVESKWMQVLQHEVRLNPDQKDTIDDWLFINYHDRINVLVEDPSPNSNERHFLVFEQSKYALEGRTSLAIIGGIIEPGEDPISAAKREVYEEMNEMVCEKYTFLGRYRTDVNRGMGWVNGFLASNCQRGGGDEGGGFVAPSKEDPHNQIGAMDTERQDLKSISLSELRRQTMKGSFLEVQWSNTVSLALLRMDE